MEKYYRFFGGFVDTQEHWLNQMACKGYRLKKTGKVVYEFEECQPNEYQYAVEFVAHKSYKSAKEYGDFLESFGYNIFFKNINLNFSVGKIKWRPFGSGMGQISTNPGSYNKELFIVEKRNDGKKFKLHTTNTDKANYFKPLRNAWMTYTIILLIFAVWQYIDKGLVTYEVIMFFILGLLCAVPMIKYQKRITTFSALSNIEE